MALSEGIIVANTYRECHKPASLSPEVTFSLNDQTKVIRATSIPARGLMDYMITLCTRTKRRSLELFPVDSPSEWDKGAFPGLTRRVFADAIGDLVSVWVWIWGR